MTSRVEPSPFGAYAAGPALRAVLAITRWLPRNWLGLRLSMPLRRIAINALHGRPVDTELWGARLRLYPNNNICEKIALFTPQMFDPPELTALADEAALCNAAGRSFTFVDVGANVGLYSIFVAAHSAPNTRILAVEPQPEILDRLRFNVRSNPKFNVVILPMAVADHEGKATLVINRRDSGGTHLDKANADPAAESVQVDCRPLAVVLALAGITSIDAMKVDIEGSEDIALAPFIREAPRTLLPRLLMIEHRQEDWAVDLYALLRERGYVLTTQCRQNVIFRLA
jgi:FkbM family methyltransferase